MGQSNEFNGESLDKAEGVVLELTDTYSKLLLVTEDKVRLEEKRILLEQKNEELNKEILSEAARKNQLLSEVLEIARSLNLSACSEVLPALRLLVSRVDTLTKIDEMFVHYMMLERPENEEMIQTLKELLLKLHAPVNINADNIQTGHDLNIASKILGET